MLKYRGVKSILCFTMGIFCSSMVHASSFQIFSGITYQNPAELVTIKKQQFIIGLTGTYTYSRFEGTSAGMTGSASSDAHLYLPYFRCAFRINDNWVAGIDATQPFASKDEYNPDSIVRFVATKTLIRTQKFSPYLAYKINDWLSVGAGIDWEYIYAHLNSVILVMPGLEGNFRNHGDDWGTGWHAGFLAKLAKGSYLSLVYYSEIHHHLHGDSDFTFAPCSDNLSVSATLPATTILRFYQYFSEQWLVLAEIDYTQWSTIQDLCLRDTALGNLPAIPLEYSNSWRFALGSRYWLNEHMAVQGQITYDQSPSNKADISVRAPDGDLCLLTVGLRFKICPQAMLDINYTHGFVDTVNIYNISTGGVLSQGHANIRNNDFNVQLTIDV